MPRKLSVGPRVVDAGVDRQELDRRDAEPLEMIDHRARAQAAIGAAPFRRHVRALLGQAFDVRLVDDGVFPRDARRLVASRDGGLVDHHRLRHAAGIVVPVERQIGAGVPGAIAEMRIAPHQAAGERFRVRVDQQLVRVEAESALGRIGT
jgi:hypothetical protein